MTDNLNKKLTERECYSPFTGLITGTPCFRIVLIVDRVTVMMTVVLFFTTVQNP